MKKILIVIAMLPLGFGVYGQSVQLKVDTTKESLQFWGNKIADLLEPGVETRNDSLIVKEEVIQLLKSAELRKAVYPEKYNWPEALGLLQKAEWKKAFWHFINLYHYDTATRNLIISSIMMYDKMIPMDKALLSSFYTYSFADPRACRLKNGKPDIFRPDLLQELLATTREIVGNIVYYRNQKQTGKPD